VIGHAGSAFYVPEETMIGYQMAAEMDSDYSEPDLQITKDLQLICMHDPTLDRTTNIKDYPHLYSRASTKVVQGKNVTGAFIIDFTLEEIKTLRVRQAHSKDGSRSNLYDWLYQVPAWDEVMDWQVSQFQQTKRLVGLMPELKNPSFYNDMGIDMEEMFLQSLTAKGYETSPVSIDLNAYVVPIIVQSFENASLRKLSQMSTVPLMQLLNSMGNWTEANLKDVSTYAASVGPTKSLFTDVRDERALEMMSWAKELNLYIVPYTCAPDNADDINTLRFKGSPYAELSYYYNYLGVGGVFVEAPDMARQTISSPVPYPYLPFQEE